MFFQAKLKKLSHADLVHIIHPLGHLYPPPLEPCTHNCRTTLHLCCCPTPYVAIIAQHLPPAATLYPSPPPHLSQLSMWELRQRKNLDKNGGNGDLVCFLKLKTTTNQKHVLHFRNRAKSIPKLS